MNAQILSYINTKSRCLFVQNAAHSRESGFCTHKLYCISLNVVMYSCEFVK